MRYLIISVIFCCGCSTVSIPDIPLYRELPFSGKALEVYTVSDSYRIVEKTEWENMKPYGLVIMPQGWAEIKKSWLKACAIAGKKCEQQMKLVGDFVEYLDDIFENIHKGVK